MENVSRITFWEHCCFETSILIHLTLATKLVEIMEEAGFPKGVVNLVHGPGSAVGNAILEHKDIGVVSFTGSSEIGRHIASVCGKTLKRVSLELGGKNAQIVMDDADIDLAVDGVLSVLLEQRDRDVQLHQG